MDSANNNSRSHSPSADTYSSDNNIMSIMQVNCFLYQISLRPQSAVIIRSVLFLRKKNKNYDSTDTSIISSPSLSTLPIPYITDEEVRCRLESISSNPYAVPHETSDYQPFRADLKAQVTMCSDQTMLISVCCRSSFFLLPVIDLLNCMVPVCMWNHMTTNVMYW